MNRVVHFEVHADDPGRAAAFYQKTFGWRFDQYGPLEYWLIYTGPPDQPGINGGLQKRRRPIDSSAVIAYVCTIDVEDLDSAIALVTANGGQCVVPRQAIPEVGWFAYCKDTEGNVFGLIENDTKVR